MPELRNITPGEFELWKSTESRAHGNRVNGGGKVDHMGGSIVGLRLSWYVLP